MSTIDKLTIVKHNNLNTAAYSMTLNEKRLIFSAISQINSKSGSVGDELTVHASDYAEHWNISTSNAYNELKAARELLKTREITTQKIESGEIWDIPWIQGSGYQDGLGYIKLKFSNDIQPYLYNLKKHFTSVKLFEMQNFTSTHTIRIFELLMQYFKADEKCGWYKVEVDELRRTLGLGDKYPRWAELRRNVIDKAINEINEKSNYFVDLPKGEMTKRGRVIHKIKFIFWYKTQPDMFKQL